ncbi:hypothetical protein Q1695_000130 [Nippostrongylus brasiliensis]|nr:hypothetical protein Q1695_000130 [Nippostrongylus brasiliensis]
MSFLTTTSGKVTQANGQLQRLDVILTDVGGQLLVTLRFGLVIHPCIEFVDAPMWSKEVLWMLVLAKKSGERWLSSSVPISFEDGLTDRSRFSVCA